MKAKNNTAYYRKLFLIIIIHTINNEESNKIGILNGKRGNDMTYEDLKVGMNLICNHSDGNKTKLKVIRKGIDGFGEESVVFQSCTSVAQFYCRASDVPLWFIEPDVKSK